MEYRDIKDLKCLNNNPRIIKDKDFKILCESIKKNKEFFEARPLIVSNRTGELIVIAGNQRLKAAEYLGIKKVPTFLLKNPTEELEKEITIRDNVNNGQWDYNLLINEWNTENLISWGLSDILTYNNFEEDFEIDMVEDEYETKITNERNIESGDIYLLGKHRLLCGDSLNEELVAKLMNNKKADMVFIDPPYNVNIENSKTKIKIQNDNLKDDEFIEFLDKSFKICKKFSKDKVHNYICCNMKCYSNFERVVNNNWKKKVSDIFIWIKDLAGLGWGYREQYEIIIFTGDMDSVVFKDKCESNVWEFPKSSSTAFRRDERDNIDTSTSILHPTIKPSFLIMRAIKNSSEKNNIVLDIFAGSGSTLIACERSNRIAYVSEIDPIYCNVIINRWEKLTGQKAKKLSNEQQSNK